MSIVGISILWYLLLEGNMKILNKDKSIEYVQQLEVLYKLYGFYISAVNLIVEIDSVY